MQIVIDIDESLYKIVTADKTEGFLMMALRGTIKTGTILPKGHGKLIDADAVIAEATEKMKYPVNHKYMECVIAHMQLAPTIIEADKE